MQYSVVTADQGCSTEMVKGGSHDSDIVIVSVNLFDCYIQIQVRDNYKIQHIIN